jgi:hypothetical protein
MTIRSRLTSITALLASVALAASVGFAAQKPTTTASTTAPAVRPVFENCTLEIGSTSLKAIAVRSPAVAPHQAGDRMIVVRDDTVEQLAADTLRPAWSLKSADGQNLSWLGASADVAYFAAFHRNEKGGITGEAPLQIRRLDLSPRRWLAPLPVPAVVKTSKDRDDDSITAVLPTGKGLLVLTSSDSPAMPELPATAPTTEPAQPAASYRLTFFRPGADKPAWSNVYPSLGRRPEPGVALWASSMPDYADAELRYLTPIGAADAIVCAGEKEDLIRLDVATGKIVWRIPRIWEYERGFIGPSVWQHFMARAALDEDQWWKPDNVTPHSPATQPLDDDQRKELDQTRRKIADARKQLDGQFECAIVGGPVVLELPGPELDHGDHRPHRAFVAVARAPAGPYWGYLSDCIVYELDAEQGEVLSRVALPRMVNGNQFAVTSDGVVWGCPQRAMVRIRAASFRFQDMDWGGGPGGRDCVAAVEWFRQFDHVPDRRGEKTPWLTSDKFGDPTAMSTAYAFRAVDGGRVATREDKLYSFPIQIIDLKTAQARVAMLRVPLREPVPPPKTNVANFNEDVLVTHGPYLLGVAGLQLLPGNRLQIALAMRESSTAVIFNVTKLMKP